MSALFVCDIISESYRDFKNINYKLLIFCDYFLICQTSKFVFMVLPYELIPLNSLIGHNLDHDLDTIKFKIALRKAEQIILLFCIFLYILHYIES